MDRDLVKLANDIIDWYSMDMGTWFDEIQGNEEEIFNETLGYLENNDVDMIQHFIDDISMEEDEIDDEEITSTSKDLVSRLKKLLNKSSVEESKKLKKESPTDDAVNSFFNQMDKYMDSKGTDMEALKGIETTANDLAQLRPEFTDMRYGDIYRALSKEYKTESKLTEAQIDNLNTLYEVFKVENYYAGKLEEGFTLDDEETKFINKMVNKDKADIENFLGYDLTDELFNDKQHLRLAIKEIYEQMPEEELSKFEEDYSKTKIQDVIRAGEELWGEDARVYETRVDGIYNCDTARHGGYLVDTNVFPELAKYGDKTSIDNIVGFEEDYEALKVIWAVPEVLEQVQLNNDWYKDLTLDKVLHYEDSLNDDFRKEFPNKKEIAEVPEMKTEAKDEDLENMFIDLFNEWESKLTNGIPELNIVEHNPKALLNCIKAEDLQYKFTTKSGADVTVDVDLKLEKTTKQFIEVLKEEVETPYVLVCHIINSYSNDTIPAEKSVVGGVIAVEDDGNITSYPLNPQVLTTDIDNCVDWLSGWVNDNIDVLSTAKLENKLKEDKMYKCITESKTITNRARRLKLEANQRYKSDEISKALTDGKVVKVGTDKGAYTPTSFYYDGNKIYFNNKEVSFGWNEHNKSLDEIVNHIANLNKRGFEVTFLDEKPEIKDERLLGPSDEVIDDSKEKGLYTENLVSKPTNFKFDKYQGIIEPNGDITYNIGTSKNKTGNKFNYNDVEDTDFPHTDNQKVKMYIKQNVLKTEGLSKDAENKNIEESKQYKFDGTDTFPQKIKTSGGYVFTKVDDGTYENAFLPVYRDENGEPTVVTQDCLNHCEVLEEGKKIEEKYYLVGIYTDEHGMEQKDYIEGAYNKEYLNHYMEEHEEELKDRDYDKMYIEDNDNIGLTESVIKCLDEGYDGWKPDVDLYTKLMKEMQDNLGISEYEIQKEADAIKFRYNGKVYFAEPRSTCQVDIFDDNHKQIGWGVVTDKIKQEVFTDYVTNQDFLYQFVGGEYAGEYTREEAEKLPIREPELTDDLDDIRARGGFVHRKELDNQFQFKGYIGPMWNGTKDGKGVIRYETPEVNDMLSR